MSFFHTLCSVTTEGGKFLMTNYKGHIFQLGKCGLEQIGSLGGSWGHGQFCGKIAGGAAFCNGFNCYTYSDGTGEVTQKPTVSLTRVDI